MVSSLIQIQWWLKQPRVWRFVGFASSVVGLLCYALSSSFNHLFGEWNLLKTFLYFVFSFIICVAVLYAREWQPSSSIRLKAHIAFLVLAITSFYSFFFDKAVNGKPDAYALISCASFAVMSLSLSRQIHCGFEVDLLYFFCGALIVQLMKIKWLLGLVGVGFSYSLIILRSSLDPQPEANGYVGFQDQPHVVIQVIGSQQSQSSANSATALAIIPQGGNIHDQTISQVHSHSQEANTDIALIKPYLLASMKALKKKNRNLINTLSNHIKNRLGSFGSDPNLLIDALPSEIINNLNEAVKLVIAAGFEKGCCHMYISCRREFLRQCLYALGIPDFDKEDNKDNVLETTTERIEGWITSFKVAFRLLFPSERRLCDRVFSGFSSVGDLSFMLVCKELTIRLLNFANAFASDIHSHKIVPGMAKVCDTILDMIPELELLFPDQYGESLRRKAIMVRKRLGEAITGIFLDLENLIRCDMGIADVPGGIYPITYDVVNFLDGIITDWHAIKKVFEKYPMVTNRGGTSPSLPVHMTRMTELLGSHLEAKSKNYTKLGLCYVSMMNNFLYLRKQLVRYRRVRVLVGEDLNHWIEKYTVKVGQNLKDYQNSSWNKVLGLLLHDNGDESVASDVAAESMKEKLYLFNSQFDEICSIQSTWFAHNDIRGEIIVSLKNMLLPAYGNFVGSFHDVLGKYAYDYIQFGMFDIEDRLNHLFLGDNQMNKDAKGQESRLPVPF